MTSLHVLKFAVNFPNYGRPTE